MTFIICNQEWIYQVASFKEKVISDYLLSRLMMKIVGPPCERVLKALAGIVEGYSKFQPAYSNVPDDFSPVPLKQKVIADWGVCRQWFIRYQIPGKFSQ